MSSLEEIRNNRIEKLNVLKNQGINPYPISSDKDYDLEEVVKNFSKLSKLKKPIKLVGRVMSIRPQGAITFFNFDDGTAKFQGLIKKESTPLKKKKPGTSDLQSESFGLFSEVVDIGDFVEVLGSLFLTKREEKTIQVSSWRMLSKSLRPLPEKWHGLQDVDERFRKRYLDTLMSVEVKNRFIVRSKIISEIRKALEEKGFLEVETPMLQGIPGGASALPFKTHYNALDIDLCLRIAPELFLKRLLIGGFPKVYELNKNFRNEGIDMTHSPEFTMLEYYESFSDKDKQMIFVEDLLKSLLKKISGKSTLTFEGTEINFSKKFNIISYYDLLKRYALISNPESIKLEEARLKASQLAVKYNDGDSMETIMDNIYKKACRPKLTQPTFVVDFPVNYLPLAKKLEDNKAIVSAFQVVIGGIEFVKAFSELNDPIDQRERFEVQEKNKKAGDSEAQQNDEEFLEAMEHGMPPAGGVGIGIDRLAMLFTDTRNIREVILFPTLRPKK